LTLWLALTVLLVLTVWRVLAGAVLAGAGADGVAGVAEAIEDGRPRSA
jgi:hypothetical protein